MSIPKSAWPSLSNLLRGKTYGRNKNRMQCQVFPVGQYECGLKFYRFSLMNQLDEPLAALVTKIRLTIVLARS